MHVKIYIPNPALQEFILNISTVSIELPEGISQVVTPYPPTPFQSILFYCNHPISMGNTQCKYFEKQPESVIVGPQSSRVNIKVHNALHAIRVDFLPGGLYRLLGIPMHELLDGGFDAVDFFGVEMKEINQQLQHIPDLETGKILVEQFLINKISSLKEKLPFDQALNMLLISNGTLTIEKTASIACQSLKQFERKCRERIGMNPKLYARILKFSHAYRMHEVSPNLSWTKIAYAAGYFDQMHMIRDFKTFVGVNPSVIEQQLLSTPIRMQKDLRY